MLLENKIQKSVNIVNTGDGMAAEVLWINQVLRDGIVIAEENHRYAYSVNDKDKFLEDVNGAEQYLTVLGWE